jgi:peptidoglycan hydrolase-like protein with peptidoglycan-binding domain
MPVPTVMLRRGARGEAVMQVQQLLAALGYEPGARDGVYGPSTVDAVSRFQTDAHARGWFPYRPDGIWSPKTASAASRQLAGE